MGIGIGGDYPLSAVISSEFASTKIRGRMMTAVFANQGWGNFSKRLDSLSSYLLIYLYPIAAALVAFIITAAYKSAILAEASITNLKSVDYMWRILIGLGCVPGVIALYFRLTIPETPRFTMDIERNIDQATADIKTVLTNTSPVNNADDLVQRVEAPRASLADFRAYFGKLENFKVLFGCAYSWFALDVSTSHVSWLVY